jgi:N-acetylmuramoyl-L-alanine amidase
MKSKSLNNVQKPYATKERKASFRSIMLGAVLALFNVSAFAVNPDSLGVRTIIIDPGHGGKDPGCLGLHSHEADVALDISLKFGKMLKEKYGSSIRVIYTRTTDEFVGLQERANMANKYKGDLFICIHANASENKESKGSEVYALGLHRSDSQLKVADRENASILMEDNHESKYSNFDMNDPDRYLMVGLLGKTYLDNSLNLAEKITKNFAKTDKLIDRGVKQAGFLVLHQVNMPSILIETGFLTNRDEELVLNDVTSQENIAKAIFDAFVDYKTEMENINGIITNNKTVEKEKEKVVEKDKENEKEKEKETNKIENPKVNAETDNTIYFMVQISASTNKIECKSSNFKGLENIEEHSGKGIYRYTYGKSPNFEEAKKLHTIARDKGYKDSFLVAYQKGERIDINRAIELAKQ